jgi:[acyl-carrier-protein] S-malonyltransferase
MRPAAVRLEAALREVAIAAPRIPFASNVTGAITEDPDSIRRQLAEQVCAPVLWERSMRLALERGLRAFLEPAPGNVLGGILAKIDPEARVRSIARPEDVESAGSTDPGGAG